MGSWLGGEGLLSVEGGDKLMLRNAVPEERSAGFAVVMVGIGAGFEDEWSIARKSSSSSTSGMGVRPVGMSPNGN